MLPCLYGGSYRKLEAEVVERYLTVVPAISNTLEDPTYGSDDTEDACDPVTTIEDTDRLDYTRRSGPETNIVGRCVKFG